jgi:hypothetical protein
LSLAGFRVSLNKGEGVCFGRAHPRAARDLGILLVRSAFTHKPHVFVWLLVSPEDNRNCTLGVAFKLLFFKSNAHLNKPSMYHRPFF